MAIKKEIDQDVVETTVQWQKDLQWLIKHHEGLIDLKMKYDLNFRLLAACAKLPISALKEHFRNLKDFYEFD